MSGSNERGDRLPGRGKGASANAAGGAHGKSGGADNFAAPHPSARRGDGVQQAKPKLAVPETRKTYSGPLELGEDLTTFEIADSVIVHHVRP